MNTNGLSVYFLGSDEVHLYVLANSYDDALLAGDELIGTRDMFDCKELAYKDKVKMVDNYGIEWSVSANYLLICLQFQHGDCEKIDMSKGYFVISELYTEQ